MEHDIASNVLCGVLNSHSYRIHSINLVSYNLIDLKLLSAHEGRELNNDVFPQEQLNCARLVDQINVKQID